MGNGVIVYTEEGDGFGSCRSGEVESQGRAVCRGGRQRMVENGSRDNF